MASSAGIRALNVDGESPLIFYPVVIVGAGPSGIAMGCRLKKKLGCDQFRIFERQGGVGGTWWANRYPGVACDVPTLFYSFSFAPNYTSKTVFPTGQEYLEYLNGVVERFGITDKIEVNTDVRSLRWIEQDQEWEIQICHLESGDVELEESNNKHPGRSETIRAKVVVSGAGILTRPNDWPEGVSGRDTFSGKIVHSAQWPENIKLEGKDVILVGSGCSAAQIAPALLQTNIKSLTQIMRSPPWIVPRIEEPGGKEVYAKYAPKIYASVPLLGFWVRKMICWVSELLWYTTFSRSHVRLRQLAEKSSLDHMRKMAPAKYHSILTPRYSIGCKRRVYDNEWLRSMSDPRYTLSIQPLVSVEGNKVNVGSSESVSNLSPEAKSYPADVIILATGFQASQLLQPLSIHGRKDASLHSVWDERGSPQAYMGTAVNGFPNFFMLMGPNTFVGHTSVIMSIENNIEYILKLIAPILTGDISSLDPTLDAARKWDQEIQRDMKERVFEGCQSWYNGHEAQNSVMYPRSQLDFYLRCLFPRMRDWNRTFSTQDSASETTSGIQWLRAQ